MLVMLFYFQTEPQRPTSKLTHFGAQLRFLRDTRLMAQFPLALVEATSGPCHVDHVVWQRFSSKQGSQIGSRDSLLVGTSQTSSN